LVDVGEILERSTRRFLIDGLLRALDWNPDDPTHVGEEVRSRSRSTGKPLFFDYLGRALDRTPALLVEAKRVDSELPHALRESPPKSPEMARLLSRELGRLKGNVGKPELVASWVKWLKELIGYVKSLSPADQQRLARVAITAGQWLIVFESPSAALLAEGDPDPDGIVCFQSFDEMEQRSDEIYNLLGRERLIDRLPLTMTPGEALHVLQPDAIQAIFRGVVVTTQMVGPVRGRYPLRLIHPAVVVTSAGRGFAITQYLATPLAEPTETELFADFLQKLTRQGDKFQADVLAQLGRPDLAPAPAAQYPFSVAAARNTDHFPPVAGSTAAQVAARVQPRSRLVGVTGEYGADGEFLVVTGESWFYKSVAPIGAECELHYWPKAKSRGVAGPKPSTGRNAGTFTSSGDLQHCEHEGLRGLRDERCHIRSLETHMCCRACIFHTLCWTPDDLPRLPCGR
jgi:hypothetical protein